MTVVFDEVKANVVGPSPEPPRESGNGAAPGPANTARQMRDNLLRLSARWARLEAD